AGGLAIETSKPLPVETRFRLELSLEGVDLPPVERLAEVVNVRHNLGRYFIGLRFYDTETADDGLAKMLGTLISSPEEASRRRFPRIRVRVPAREPRDDSPEWQLQELSMNGLRLERLGGSTRKDLEPGSRFEVELKFPERAVRLTCAVAWMINGADGEGPRLPGAGFEPPAAWPQLLAEVALGQAAPEWLSLEL